MNPNRRIGLFVRRRGNPRAASEETRRRGLEVVERGRNRFHRNEDGVSNEAQGSAPGGIRTDTELSKRIHELLEMNDRPGHQAYGSPAARLDPPGRRVLY
jgi:hypothetical protein